MRRRRRSSGTRHPPRRRQPRLQQRVSRYGLVSFRMALVLEKVFQGVLTIQDEGSFFLCVCGEGLPNQFIIFLGDTLLAQFEIITALCRVFFLHAEHLALSSSNKPSPLRGSRRCPSRGPQDVVSAETAARGCEDHAEEVRCLRLPGGNSCQS